MNVQYCDQIPGLAVQSARDRLRRRPFLRTFVLPIAWLSIALSASGACAAERYVEVWNPPEARAAQAHGAAQKKTSRKAPAKKPSQTIAKKVTDPAASNAGSSPSATPPVKVRPIDPNIDIPRKIGPDGHVLRV
jgi:hypothetical protein